MSIIINVGRQIGSGGRVIAQKLATTFNATFYDREILELAAKESGFAKEVFERNDEHKGFFRSLFNLHAPNMSGNFYTPDLSQEALFKLQSDAIRKAASEGPCVFVGRCADYVLRDFPEVFNVFVTASIGFRIAHVKERHGCSEEEALRLIEKGESDRASYYNYYTGKRWGAADNYHLCVDASLLGVEATADFIADFIRSCQNSNRHE
ncbi:MAG: cytidylate kinase-like family protein [Prevotella sp.]|nr:cytidylate kinase-like family protein [Prevotella sp.]